MRRRHRGAVVIGVAGGQVVGVGTADDRAVDLAARCGHAKAKCGGVALLHYSERNQLFGAPSRRHDRIDAGSESESDAGEG